MKRLFIISLCLLIVFSCTACNDTGSKSTGYISPDKLASSLTNNSAALYIDGENSHGKFAGIGAECDPTWYKSKVGQQQSTKEGMRYTPKEEDWNDYILESMKESSLQRVRMMLIDRYYCTSQNQITTKEYNWNSTEMKDVYLILDTAEQLGMQVNITFWGLQNDWIRTQYGDYWVRIPAENDSAEQMCCDLFVDAIDYLINVKGYTCINDVTLFNEPNIIYNNAYRTNELNTFPHYKRLVKKLHETFIAKGIRDKVKFCMSDDGENLVWLEKSAAELSDICEIFATHTYNLNDDTSKNGLINTSSYKYATIKEIADTYDVPIYFNEFGVNNNVAAVESFASGFRGITISRAIVTSMNYGILAYSFWTYYSIHGVDPYVLISYNYNDEEQYIANQLYYAYSLFCRLTDIGSTVYYINAEHEKLCAIALKNQAGEWTYIAVNNSENDMQVCFANCYEQMGEFNKYVYSENGNYTKKEQIQSSGKITSNERITDLSIPAGSLVILSVK